jgi:hypothetical protein
MGVLKTFFSFQAAILIRPLTIFGTSGMPPVEAPVRTPIAK